MSDVKVSREELERIELQAVITSTGPANIVDPNLDRLEFKGDCILIAMGKAITDEKGEEDGVRVEATVAGSVSARKLESMLEGLVTSISERMSKMELKIIQIQLNRKLDELVRKAQPGSFAEFLMEKLANSSIEPETVEDETEKHDCSVCDKREECPLRAIKESLE